MGGNLVLYKTIFLGIACVAIEKKITPYKIKFCPYRPSAIAEKLNKMENNMNKTIELSDEQYKSLVKLIFYGDWILHANKIGEAGIDQKTEEVREYIFRQKEKFSMENWFKNLEYGEELKEEVIMDLLEEVFKYNEDTFWFYLVQKLAQRDVSNEYSNGEKITEEGEEEKRMQYEEKYEKAFKYREIEKLYLRKEK